MIRAGVATMARRIAIAAAAALIGSAGMAFAQQNGAETGQNFPDGLGKDTVVSICGGCHELNRLTAGYTPEGWLAVTTMMHNFGAPVPDDQWQTVRAYLINQGIDPNSIMATGYGKADPVASNDTPSGRQQNRRVEIIISGEIIGTQIGHDGVQQQQTQPQQ